MLMAAVVNHYKENECMRLAMEELLYDNGVDVILNGHCHEYERSNPVYVSPCSCHSYDQRQHADSVVQRDWNTGGSAFVKSAHQ